MPNNVRSLQKLQEETKNDTENLPDPDILARDITGNLESARKLLYCHAPSSNVLLTIDLPMYLYKMMYIKKPSWVRNI